jgi:nucleoside 2-deoxyribosyltransferase
MADVDNDRSEPDEDFLALPRLFFGYSSQPETRRSTLAAAAAQIGRMVPADTRTWEQLQGASGFIIDDVVREIDAADVSIFDLTDLNENVLFEVGYAIGSRSAVWILRDPTFPDKERAWKQMGTLTTIRYAGYTSTDDIRIAFVRERPDLGRQVIFDEGIGPALQPEEVASLFYVKSLHDTDASRALTRRIHNERSRGIRIVEADPAESSYESLAWYAQQIYGQPR